MTARKVPYPYKFAGKSGEAKDWNELKEVTDDHADKLGGLDLEGSTAITWNDDFKTINIPTETGSTLQVGQEFYFLIYNNTGDPITNGQILKPVGAFVVGENVIPTVILAKADKHTTCEGTLFFATSDIDDGSLGMATRLGRVNDIDTDGFTPGADLFLSATIAGGYTTTRPAFPNYTLGVGGVLKADLTEGQIAVSFQIRVEDTVLQSWDGSIRENFDFLVSSAGGVVTGSLERTGGGGDLTMMFSDGFSILETPPATIVLTPGTDTVPAVNYVYVLQANKVLEISTSGWPEDQHIKIADIYLYSASLTELDGALTNRNWNNHIKVVGDNGHLLHITEKLRRYPSQWDSGVLLSSVVNSGPTPDDVFIAVTAGEIYQLHKQTYNALDLETGDHAYVINHNVTPYLKITNLNVLLADANGDSLNNTSFSLVVWGVVNKTGQPDQLLINLPTGSYAYVSPVDAFNDVDNFSVYTIPKEFTGVGFLIARLVCTYKNDVWTIENEIDLRGTFPNTAAGGGTPGASSYLGLNDTSSSYLAKAGISPTVNVAEDALELESNIKTTSTGVNLSNIPTSASGLSAGDLWNDAGILKIV